MSARVTISRRRIVLTTWGSLGDLHPYLAIGLGLAALGHEVIVGTAECYRQKIESLGLGFRPVRPDCTWLSDHAAVRRLADPTWGLIRVTRMVLADLRLSYEDTLAATHGAALLVGSLATMAARLVAEKQGIPWVSAMHIPTLFFSAYDPPLLPGFPGPSKALRFLGPAFWRPFGRFVNGAAGWWFSGPLRRLRREIGLGPAPEVNSLTEGLSPRLHLALFSRLLLDKQPDWPAQTIVTGFPWYDHPGGGLPPELARFLDDGPPPIVFTLGSAVAADAGPFFQSSALAARLLGRRAVLILKDSRNRLRSLPEGVVCFDYAPFSELFPRAAAIVHHGGIGTTGLAMRAGRPQLVMPCAWDQPDNADRAVRLGIARTIARRRYTPDRAAGELRRLLGPAYARRAAAVGAQVSREDGVRVACDALEQVLAAAGA